MSIWIDVSTILLTIAAGCVGVLVLGKIAKNIERRQHERERRAWLNSPERQELFDEWLAETEERKKRSFDS